MKLILALAAAAAISMTMEATTPEGSKQPQIAPARDGNVAIQEELDGVRRAGTVAAYDLFIERHPGHPLEAVAREERARLQRRAR